MNLSERERLVAAAEQRMRAGEAATELLDQARALGPPDDRLLCALGVAAFIAGDGERARACFERALVLDPDCLAAAENLLELEFGSTVAKQDDPTPSARPEVSVIIPTHGRTDRLRELLRRLDGQTLSPERFEVIVVDDGSPEPVAGGLNAERYRFRLELLRQSQSGPAAARNRAIAIARGDELLILNDDAVPDSTLIAAHLAARRRHGADVAILGSFDYSVAARESPFTRLLEATQATFAFASCPIHERGSWSQFWTCNLLVRKEHVIAVGGFDDTLPDPMCEDIDLGWRLFRDRDVGVVYAPEAACAHDHTMTVASFRKRQILFGRNMARLAMKYGNPGLMGLGWAGPFDEGLHRRMRRDLPHARTLADEAADLLDAYDRGAPLEPGAVADDAATLARGRELIDLITLHGAYVGFLDVWDGTSFSRTAKEFPTTDDAKRALSSPREAVPIP